MASLGKKEREKLKETKRQEKQKRRDKNQSGGTRSFDEMIAYVDEFGVLHSTPPETEKEEIDISEIEISTPKKEAVEIEPQKGRIDFFNAEKGFGFVKDNNSGEKYFFHISAAPATIAEGNKITFTTEKGARGMNAVNIVIIK